MPRSLLVLAVFALVVAACADADSTDAPDTSVVVAFSSTQVPAGEFIVFAGTVEIPGAQTFGEPGFHEALVLAGVVPEPSAGISGRLVVRLRDVGRPTQTCDRDHPLSGCVTVDWSDFEDRPNVPPGGVFDNRLTTVSAAGPIEMFLSEDGLLATVPDQYSPT